MNVVQLFLASVVRDPRRACLQFKEASTYQTLSYAEVWETVQRLAYALHARGVGRDSKVAILAASSPRWLMADLAVQALGAIVVPIYPSASTADAAFILRNAEVSWLLTDDVNHMERLRDEWPTTLQGTVLLHQEAKEPAEGPVFGTQVETWDRLLQSAAKAAPVAVRAAVHPDDVPATAVATIVHTSGTSGRPKGVVLTHANLVANIQAALSTLSVSPDDVALSYLPLSHILERTVGHYCMLTAGASIAYAEGIDAIANNLTEVRPTLLVTVPRLLEKVYDGICERLRSRPGPIRRLVEAGIQADRGVLRGLADRAVYAKVRAGLGGRMRAVVSGGASLSPEVGRFFTRAGIPVLEGYGMTETAPVIAVNRMDQVRFGTVGLPLPGVEVRVAEDGELLVRGPNVMQGYYRDEAATAEVLDPDGWLHTGDVAEIDEDGYLRIVDRKKHLLVLATGKNVAPAPIESAITRCPSIADAVVVGDGYKFVGCLLVPDFAALAQPASRLGLPPNQPAAWLAHPVIRRRLQAELQAALESFAPFERPKRAVLLPSPFTIESGELTPTLKVKAKAVTARYRDEIEAMYAGHNCLEIYGDLSEAEMDPADASLTEATSADMADDEVASEAPAKRALSSRRKWTLGIAAAVCVLGAAGGAAAATGVRLPKGLNLPGTIRQIGQTNVDINRKNQQVVAGLSQAEHLSALTPRMSGQLQELNQGLAGQNQVLLQLRNLSQQEVGLSHQFGSVASRLQSELATIQSNSQAEADAMAQMAQVTGDLGQQAAQLQQTNAQLASRLSEARDRTQTVAAEVP
ncbi:MAG: long-chain fatty acid--CoA ligase [Alicyclobacillus sp.]|nr:long-chain fatty acid--CoA ligase [Alicyclobacillus sp.]